MPRPSKDDADFEGPIRLLVAGGLAAMLWVLFKQSQASAAASQPLTLPAPPS